MEGTKRFRIPTLEEMEGAPAEKEPESSFKRRKALTTDILSTALTLKSTDSSTSNVSSTKAAKTENTTTQAGVRQTSSVLVFSSTVQQPESSSSSIIPHQTSPDISKHDKRTGEAQVESSHIVDDATEGAPIVSRPGSSRSLIVNTRQRGNPILKSIRNVTWEYGHIVPDYVMGQTNCALFLSLRYHQLHPNYIHERLKLLGRSYDLRVMLVQVDVKESHHVLKDLAKICLLANCTLILAFSPEEAARYLESYKIFENKPPEAIMEKTEENYMAKSLTSIMEASAEDLSLCPGFGPQKARRLHSLFHEPFIRPRAVDIPKQ